MKNLVVGFAIAVFSTLSLAHTSGVKKLEWIDPYGRRATEYSSWSRERRAGEERTEIGRVYRDMTGKRQNVVDIVVNAGTYSQIIPELTVFSQDLSNEGYLVQIDTLSGMSHFALRSHLASIDHLVGAVFVGELPVAWFETNGFGDWEEFPCDLYFCDLNGTFIDLDGDGVYDDHVGDVAPEIWVGRLYSRNLTWDNEIRLLKNYFEKNHQYRVDSLSLSHRGLSFVDDDWSYWTTCHLDLVYETVVVVNDNYQTTAANYRTRLDEGYEWIQICAHSSPWGHTFKYGSDQYRGTVFNYEIFTLDPKGFFYNLFACSGTRFTEENCSAGWYLFVDPYGILIVGSAKTGSMLNFDDFYGPIGQQDMCIGEAFKHWFGMWGETSWDWYYGMNILGDPTLKPKEGMEMTAEPQNSFLLGDTRQWESPEVVGSDIESDGFPKIATNADGKVWVVWESGRSYINGRSEIYGAYRDGGGWLSATNIGPTLYWDYCPDINIDVANRPVAVWAGWDNIGGNYQYDIFYSVYEDSWSDRDLIHSVDPGFDLKPALVKDGVGRLWVTWESRRDIDLNIYASYFDGISWTSPPQQVTTDPADETTPSMVVDSLGRPWVFYCRRSGVRAEIFGSYYDESQWLESGLISSSHVMAYRPTAAVDGAGRIWVAWQSADLGNPEIFASYFNGSVWSSPFQISSSLESDLFPSLTTDNSGVVWLVYQSKEGGDWNIYFSDCVDSIWTTPSVLANISGADINPQITCSNSNELWVAWQSYSTNNWEIMVSHRQAVSDSSTFIRADADADSDVRMSDAILTLRYLYVPGTPNPTCMDATDSNDSGDIGMSDAVYTLKYLYIPDAPKPPEPFPGCGQDPTVDALRCDAHPCMEGTRQTLKYYIRQN